MSHICKRTVEFKKYTEVGGYDYSICGCKAKYKVEFIDPIKGKLKTEILCGKHFIALQKNFNSLKKRTGFDVDLKFEVI